ncbi:transcription regulator protein BACH1b [Takifugu rubripes]|uniref:Transcription regulator protein BACH2-like n=1 Tax=Takifugu rubripes TaxID=31033 RepID=A0A3B5KA51_TAKRU|nr:transcription regulator protein BACH2-like [Takifugu rubripes]
MAMSAPKLSVFTYESTLHSCHVLRRLDEQRLRDALCDVTVLVEGHGFRAHRSVLAACSEYFAHRISSLTQQGAVIAAPPEVTAAGFEPLLKFAYTSKLLFSTDNVADIRKSASVLGFRDLEDACFDFLAPKLSGGDGPAAFLRKTCCQKKRKRRLSIEEAGTGPGDATRGDGELKAVADSSTQQETSRCCSESANSKTESRSGATQHYRQCPKYRRQLACEREICSRRQSLPAPATEDNLRNKEEEKRRESTPNASTLADRAEDHERGPEIIKEETNETEGGSVEMGRDPHVTERCDAESAFLGSSFVLAEGSLGLILKRCPLTTFGEDPGSPGEGRFARHPKGEKLIRSPCVPAPTAVRQKTGKGAGGQAAGVEGGALSVVEREVAEHLAQRLGSDLTSLDPDARNSSNTGTTNKPPQCLDLHLQPKPSSCSFFREQNRCPWSGAELSEWEGASQSGLSSLNSGEDGDSGTETERDSESYTRERAKEVQLPFSVDWVVDLSRNDFQQLLKQQDFTREQLEFVHDMRRRSKNRLAAQRCRKRKLDCIYNLQCEINKLKAKREKLIVEKSHLGQLKMKTCDNVSTLCQEVCREAGLQPQQLQVLARYTSPECPLSSIFPHIDTLLSQRGPGAQASHSSCSAELHEPSSEENATSSPDTLQGDCQHML